MIETFDYPDERTIKVTYDGWPKKWNEWIGGTSRVRISANPSEPHS